MNDRIPAHVPIAAGLVLLVTTAAALPVPVPVASAVRTAEPTGLASPQEGTLEERIQHFVTLHYADARGRLEDGDHEGAFSQVRMGLAMSPYDVEGYDLALEIATGAEDREAQLHWAKWIYWASDAAGDSDRAGAMAARLAELAPNWNLDGELVEAWNASVMSTAERAGKSRQYQLAGYLMNKLLDQDPSDKDVNKAFDKLFKKAGESMSGGAFTAAKVRRRSPRWIAKTNQSHESWDKAFKRNTGHYKVITNISFEFFETVCVVMDEMYDFYQDVYGYKKKAPPVTLAIHRKRSDFDRYCQDQLGGSLSLGVGGWFWDKKMTVAAYDRTESGTDLSDLWGTLFHEASHQFMYLTVKKKTKQDPPTWLNEGTASYFEGCELKPDGTIIKNKPALGRLREWESIERGDQRHSLKQLITQPIGRGSYDGSYYSYGWALVYFLNNYEDEDGVQIYREPYLKYLRSYTKKGPKKQAEAVQEAFDRAERFFVEDVPDPEAKTWQDFEDRWRTYIQMLVGESKAGPELADTLQERCETYLERKDFGRALIVAEQADYKRPNDPDTWRLLALSYAGLGQDGDAVYWMVRHWEGAWNAGDDDAVSTAESWLKSNDGKAIVEGYCAASKSTLTKIDGAMRTAIASEQPTLATLFATHAMQIFGAENELLRQRTEEARDMATTDLRLWRRAFQKSDASNRRWSGTDVVRYDPDGVLINNPSGPGRPVEACAEPSLAVLAPPFSMRGRVETDGEGGGYLQLGIGATGKARTALRFFDGTSVGLENVILSYHAESASTTVTYQRLNRIDMAKQPKTPFLLEVGVEEGTLQLADDAAHALPDEFTAERLTGGFGLSAAEDCAALFSEIEVRPGRPFWPVNHPEEGE